MFTLKQTHSPTHKSLRCIVIFAYFICEQRNVRANLSCNFYRYICIKIDI